MIFVMPFGSVPGCLICVGNCKPDKMSATQPYHISIDRFSNHVGVMVPND